MLRGDDGQDLVEYGLIGLIVLLGALAGVGLLSTKINSEFSRMAAKLNEPSDFGKITKILDSLPQGQIAFNPPSSMEVDTHHSLYVYLSQEMPLNDLEKDLQSQLRTQPIETHQIKIAPVMQAALEGDTFSILPAQPVTQAVDPRITKWVWDVTPKRGGNQQLRLTLSVILNLDGKDYPHAIQTFERTIDVHVTTWRRVNDFGKDHWEWSCASILVIGGWIRHWHQRRSKPKSWEVA